MKASDFVPPPRRAFPRWARIAALIPLYGIAWPIVKALEAVGQWPKLMGGRIAAAAAFGDYRPSAHDVIVCSYFKAGTTWTLQMATQIAFRGQAEFDNLHHVVPWPDVPGTRRRPSHDSARRSVAGRALADGVARHQDASDEGADVPFVPEARYIAVTRDPKDCLRVGLSLPEVAGVGAADAERGALGRLRGVAEFSGFLGGARRGFLGGAPRAERAVPHLRGDEEGSRGTVRQDRASSWASS